MSDEKPIVNCPTCGAAATLDGEKYSATLHPAQIAAALDNELVARAVIAILPKKLRLGLAGVLLEAFPGEQDGFFTTLDVEDEAEAGLRSLDVAKQLDARKRFEEGNHFRGLSERHQKRALKITALLTDAEQQLIKQRVHGGPVKGTVPGHIRIVTQ